MESTQIRHHDAWNKGKLVAQKAPFKLKEIWLSGFAWRCRADCGNSPCLISASTASCVLAIF